MQVGIYYRRAPLSESTEPQAAVPLLPRHLDPRQGVVEATHGAVDQGRRGGAVLGERPDAPGCTSVVG
jgi:hypothetical protein